jgi:hypothetical protein
MHHEGLRAPVQPFIAVTAVTAIIKAVMEMAAQVHYRSMSRPSASLHGRSSAALHCSGHSASTTSSMSRAGNKERETFRMHDA